MLQKPENKILVCLFKYMCSHELRVFICSSSTLVSTCEVYTAVLLKDREKRMMLTSSVWVSEWMVCQSTWKLYVTKILGE